MEGVITRKRVQEINPYSGVGPYTQDIGKKLYQLVPIFGQPKPITQRSIDWSKAVPVHKRDQKANRIGTVAKILDWGVFAAAGGLQAGIIAYEFFNLKFLAGTAFSGLPAALTVARQPLSIFFSAMAVVEGVVEAVNLYKVGRFFHKIQRAGDPLQGLSFLHNHYFTLTAAEKDHIYEFIEKGNESLTDKQQRFNQVAEESLDLKLSRLKRRISPGLAEGVARELGSIMQDLKSYYPPTRALAKQRAKVLMTSVKRQVRNQILVHALALAAIACTLTSMIGVFLGLTAPVFFIALGVAVVSLMILQASTSKWVVARETHRFNEEINRLKAGS